MEFLSKPLEVIVRYLLDHGYLFPTLLIILSIIFIALAISRNGSLQNIIIWIGILLLIIGIVVLVIQLIFPKKDYLLHICKTSINGVPSTLNSKEVNLKGYNILISLNEFGEDYRVASFTISYPEKQEVPYETTERLAQDKGGHMISYTFYNLVLRHIWLETNKECAAIKLYEVK